MPKANLSALLDRAIDALLAPGAAPRRRDGAAQPAALAALARVAAELRGLPREDFKASLRAKLEGRTSMASTATAAAEPQQSVTAYLAVNDAARAIEFYKQAFGAVETFRLNGPGDKIGHAQIRIGNTTVMLSDESPDYGVLSAQTIGGSPVRMHLDVSDADAFVARAVAAGAKIVSPMKDQFYGDRSGRISDPFGFTWIVAMHKETVSPEEMQRRFDSVAESGAPSASAEAERAGAAVSYIRAGFRTLTPYLLVPGAANLISFYKRAFGAEEIFRVPRPGTDLIMHAELRIAGSMVELADATAEFKARASANILYVPDVDAVFQRAVEAGGAVVAAPTERPWGDRDGAVRDTGGNTWYITTHRGGEHVTGDTPAIVPAFQAQDSNKYVEFLEQAFGAQEVFAARDAAGKIKHVRLRIGNSILAGGDVHGELQSAPFLLHMYVPNTDEAYANALRCGATSIRGLEDAPYGDRTATVQDPAGNLWSLATHVKDVKF
jgi:PhnB protein